MKHIARIINVVMVVVLVTFLPLVSVLAEEPVPVGTPTSEQEISADYYIPAILPTDLLPKLETPLFDAVQQGIATFDLMTNADIEKSRVGALRTVTFDGRVLTIDLIGATTLSESQWGDVIHTIDLKVSDSLYTMSGRQGLNVEYYVLLDGKPLEEVLGQQAGTVQESGILPDTSQSVNGIQGQKIVLSPGHGYYKKTNESWYLQRGINFGIYEDFINLDLVVDLNRFVSASGGNPRPTRQVNKSAGNHSTTGNPWWQMGASEYIRSLGAPQSVWLPLPYSSNYDHDIAARPEYANWLGANSMVSIHNNGGGSTNCNSHGTETWYDTHNGYQTQSLNLANAIHGNLIRRIREQWDANWCDRGVKGSNGAYGENRRFRGPGVIVELAFMDVQSDNSALQNPTFRSIAMAAINEALVQYHGNVTCPTISGWRGEYWNNRSLSGLAVMCRNDGDVNFNWGSGGPQGSVLNDQFSARWTRTVNLSSGRYKFHLKGDDGIRLWVDGALIIEAWRDQGPTEYTAERDLGVGNHSLKVEYYENSGDASVRLWWEMLPTNMALNRPTWATSQESTSYSPPKANDGNTGTRWSSKTTNSDEWWRVDLGSEKSFDRVVIRWENAYAASHFVGWSNDGTNFTGNWWGLSSPGSYTYNLGLRTARYVAVVMRKHAPCCGNYSFWEFETYRNTTSLTTQDATEATIEILGPISNTLLVYPVSELVTVQAPEIQLDSRLFLPLVTK